MSNISDYLQNTKLDRFIYKNDTFDILRVSGVLYSVDTLTHNVYANNTNLTDLEDGFFFSIFDIKENFQANNCILSWMQPTPIVLNTNKSFTTFIYSKATNSWTIREQDDLVSNFLSSTNW